MLSIEDQLSNLRTDFDEALSNDDYDLASEINEQIEELSAEKFELGDSRPKLLNTKVCVRLPLAVSLIILLQLIILIHYSYELSSPTTKYNHHSFQHHQG